MAEAYWRKIPPSLSLLTFQPSDSRGRWSSNQLISNALSSSSSCDSWLCKQRKELCCSVICRFSSSVEESNQGLIRLKRSVSMRVHLIVTLWLLWICFWQPETSEEYSLFFYSHPSPTNPISDNVFIWPPIKCFFMANKEVQCYSENVRCVPRYFMASVPNSRCELHAPPLDGDVAQKWAQAQHQNILHIQPQLKILLINLKKIEVKAKCLFNSSWLKLNEEI